MLELAYSLVIEATDDPEFFAFYSPELEGFTGVGHSVEDCLYRARWGMKDHVQVMRQRRMRIPKPSRSPTVTIQNERKRKSA